MKKTKLPAFLIAHHDLVNPEAVYIIYTRKPAFIAQAISFSSIEDCQQYIQESKPEFAVESKRVPIIFQLVLSFDTPSEETSRILRRMADWYYYTHLKPTSDK